MGVPKDSDNVAKAFEETLKKIDSKLADAERMSKKWSDRVDALSNISDSMHEFLSALEDLENLESGDDE